ncbi:hypothetical protein LCGC14_2450180, partial [marine sediment metagenome]
MTIVDINIKVHHSIKDPMIKKIAVIRDLK